MKAERLTEARFLRDIAEHGMAVLFENGVYRHVRFQKPGTSDMLFDLITWPGHLCYCGDMGSYTFARANDMFKFFNHEKPNPSYWAEKVIGIDRDGLTMFSHDKFTEEIETYMEAADRSEGYDMAKLRAAVQDQILDGSDEYDERAAREAIHRFEYQDFCFHDFYECSLSDWTFRFEWCCYALSWGVRPSGAAAEPTWYTWEQVNRDVHGGDLWWWDNGEQIFPVN